MQSLGGRLCPPRVSRLTRCVFSIARNSEPPRAQPFRRQISTEHGSPLPEGIGPNVARALHTEADIASNSAGPIATPKHLPRHVARPLPISCPGCGALSQQTENNAPGYYTRSRKHVRAWFKSTRQGDEHTKCSNEPEAVGDAQQSTLESVRIPFCDRCHDLVHSHKGVSIDHPSIEDIADSIAESPHKHNHVYHILDAADFPMSLIPAIHSALSLAKPRSQNRRSQHDFSVRPTMSFIVTRSDLLAPTKEKVDGLMPYFRSMLRHHLGSTREGMRLGNLHLVSAKRGWWTKELKDEIWKRGGGNWMVGKFNVGKSNLFEVIFPKGSGDRAAVYSQLVKEQSKNEERAAVGIPEYLSEGLLLPPPQPEVPFPTLPLVSSLPGTTASPIRLPFGNKKGELIDMPGLERGNLDQYVSAEHRLDLVMEDRPKVKQHSIKPGQSLLLGGGVVRITPVLGENDTRTVMLAYPFVPLDAHVTSTEKAIGTQQQERESGIESILASNVGSEFRSAGVITLETDVTKLHAGAIVRSGVDVSKLPFRIYAADVLIQGVGWVEVACQVRRRKLEAVGAVASADEESVNTSQLPSDLDMPLEDFRPYTPQLASTFELPRIEVFTPNGEHISMRPPMNAWTLWKEGTLQKSRKRGVRPRKSMKGAKRKAKMA